MKKSFLFLTITGCLTLLLVNCKSSKKATTALDKQVQAIKEKIQTLENGPSNVVQGDIAHKGNIDVEGSVEVGHDAKGRMGHVKQGNISMEGNVVSKSGGFRLGHSA